MRRLDVLDRMMQLVEAEREGDVDAALEGVVWVWKNATDEEWGAVRETALVPVMQRLIAASTKARTVIAGLREQAAPGSNDWLVLSGALGDEDALLVWFDDARASGERVALTDELVMLLQRRGRWRELGELIRDPLEMLAQWFPKPPPGLDDAGARAFAEYRDAAALVGRTGAAGLVRALLAAGRAAEAERVAGAALASDGSKEMREALVSARASST